MCSFVCFACVKRLLRALTTTAQRRRKALNVRDDSISCSSPERALRAERTQALRGQPPACFMSLCYISFQVGFKHCAQREKYELVLMFSPRSSNVVLKLLQF